ncbi:hypothetical protein Dimus_024279 [Dionaea muscipula]
MAYCHDLVSSSLSSLAFMISSMHFGFLSSAPSCSMSSASSCLAHGEIKPSLRSTFYCVSTSICMGSVLMEVRPYESSASRKPELGPPPCQSCLSSAMEEEEESLSSFRPTAVAR